MTHPLNLVGFASGIAANNVDCALGPWYIYYHPELFDVKSMKVHWEAILPTTSSKPKKQTILCDWWRSLLCYRYMECGCAC